MNFFKKDMDLDLEFHSSLLSTSAVLSSWLVSQQNTSMLVREKITLNTKDASLLFYTMFSPSKTNLLGFFQLSADLTVQTFIDLSLLLVSFSELFTFNNTDSKSNLAQEK
tara:strand:- start:291 stop:620 length:330 start_codon:yes stop_codon:yes gene_type:complete